MDERRHVVAAVALAIAAAACKGNGASAPSAARQTTDDLLALAPAGTTVALVASPRGVELLEATRVRGRAIGAIDPVAGQAVSRVEEALGAALGVPAGASLPQLGLGADRGFALFSVGRDEAWVTVWPVVDRAGFLAAFHGQAGADGVDSVVIAGDQQRCRTTRGVYACADDVAVLDRLGTGSLAGRPAAAGARGDLELVAIGAGNQPPTTTFATVALDPGQLVLRLHVDAALDELVALGLEPTTVPAGRASGFLGLPIPRSLADQAGGPAGAVLAALRGPITAMAPSGVADIDVRIPLAAPEIVRDLLARCDRLPLSDALIATVDGEACVVTTRQPPVFTATAWIDGHTLRINKTGEEPAAAVGPEPTATGRELAAGSWTAVAWGRGSLLSVPAPGPWSGADDPSTGAFARAVGYLAELGVGVRLERTGMDLTVVVRTVLANPPAIADALPALVARATRGEDVSQEARALAAAHPGSPFADDLAAGRVGLMLPTAGLGMVAAVVIPKFLDYMKKAKRSEAELNLAAIAKVCDAELAETGRFPVATAPLTPARPCCEGPGHRCEPREADWLGVAAWDALGFELTAPHYFQYSYASDGTSVVAEAVGDLDCDGVTVTYSMRGTVDGTGAARWQLQKPPRAD